jgi:hypothetical protein
MHWPKSASPEGNPGRFTDSVNRLCDELEQRIEKRTGVAPDTTLVLAEAGGADALLSGDRDLLELAGSTAFAIETPARFRRRLDATY